MKKETAQAILSLLQRVNLQGSEVPAYNQIVAELGAIISPLPEEEKKDKK